MLVLCVGMYRACSTWQYGVVGAILEKHRNSRRLGFVTGIYFPEKVELDQSGNDWLMLKAHDAHDEFAKVLSAGEAIGIYSYRDLQDVVFSFMHVAGTDFDTLMERGFVELCLNNDRFWRAQPGMLIQAYDDLIADPVRGVQQIADHLGVVLEAGEAESIAEAMSWESNRRKVDSMADRLRTEGTTLRPDDESIIDPVSLLHWNHIRSTNSTSTEQPRDHAPAAFDRAKPPLLVEGLRLRTPQSGPFGFHGRSRAGGPDVVRSVGGRHPA